MSSFVRYALQPLRVWRVILFLVVLVTGIGTLGAQEMNWKQMNGPNVNSGGIPAIHPKTGDVYTMTGVGLMRSTNHGKHWIAVPVAEGYIPFSRIYFGSTGTIYGIDGRNCSRSTDNGSTWVPADSGLPSTFGQIAIDSSGELYAAQFYGNVYRSTNDGELWERADNGFTIRGLNDLVVAPDGALIVARTDSGLYRSTDKGTSWNHIDGDIGARAIYRVVGRGSLMLASGSNRIFRSVDSGQSWQMIDTIPYSTPYTILGIGLNQKTGTIIAALSDGMIVRSTDNGVTWTEEGMPLGGVMINYFVIDESGAVFANTYYDGLLRSTDDGKTWEPINISIPAALVLDVAADSSGVVVASTSGGSVYRSSDNGMTWENVGRPAGTVNITQIVIAHNGAIIGGTQGYGFYRSTDDGKTWAPSNVGLRSRFDSTAFDLMVASNGAIFVATGNSFFRSEDNGDSWWRVANGMTTINASSISEGANGDLYASTSDGNGGLFYSSDNGATWNETKLMGRSVSKVLASSHGIVIANYRDTIGMSSDAGETWSVVRTGVSNTQMAANATGDMFITYGTNLIRSMDNGETWESVYGDLPASTTIRTFAFLPDGRLLLGTNGRSIFRSETSTLDVASSGPKSSVAPPVADLFPNPLSTSTTFRFFQQYDGDVTIRVSDPTGRLVQTIDAGHLEAGEQSIVCDMSTQPSGTYFYECQVGTAVIRGVMMVAR